MKTDFRKILGIVGLSALLGVNSANAFEFFVNDNRIHPVEYVERIGKNPANYEFIPVRANVSYGANCFRTLQRLTKEKYPFVEIIVANSAMTYPSRGYVECYGTAFIPRR